MLLPSLSMAAILLFLFFLSLVPLRFFELRFFFAPLVSLMGLILIESGSCHVDQNLFPLTIVLVAGLCRKRIWRRQPFIWRDSCYVCLFFLREFGRFVDFGISPSEFVPRSLAINHWRARLFMRFSILWYLIQRFQRPEPAIVFPGVPFLFVIGAQSHCFHHHFQLCAVFAFEVYHLATTITLILTFLMPRIMLQWKWWSI